MTPILWSFRRCPYAMRARLAISVSGQQVELREVLLRDKAQAFLDTSPTATVPCLDTGDEVIDESFDIMIWALRQNDPEGWLKMPDEGFDLVTRADGPFKTALDRYKYHTRYEGVDAKDEREKASAFLQELDERLLDDGLFGPTTLADMAILPFVRQFSFVDKAWFDAQDWPNLSRWLEAFLASDRFAAIMGKYAIWQPSDAPTRFP